MIQANIDIINNKEETDANSPDSVLDSDAEFKKKVQKLQASIARTTLCGIELYDQYTNNWYKIDLPYRRMEEFSSIVYSYVSEHDPFSEEGFDEWLDQMVGVVDWDNMEW